MATETEALVVALEARIRDFEKNFQKANRTANKNFEAIEGRAKRSADTLERTMAQASSRVAGVFKTFGAGLIGGIAAGGIAGLVGQIGQVAQGIAEIGDQAKLAGLSMQAFQEWKAVAIANRVPVDALADAFKELSIRADEFAVTGKGSAAEAFQRLGLTPAEVKAKLADPSAFMLELIERTRQLGDTAAGVRIFDELFGGQGGGRFVALIDQGADGIRKTIDEAHRLGNVLDDDVITRAAEVDRQFKVVSQTVGNALKGAIIDAITALQDFIDRFNGFEARRDESLADDAKRLGMERLDIERQILELQDKQRRGEGAGDGIFGTSIGESTVGEAKYELQRRMEAIAAEEKMITDVLEARRKLRETPPQSSVPVPPPVPVSVPSSGGSRSRSTAKTEVDSERQAVAGLIAELERELSLIGATDLEREISNQLRRAGSAATDEQKAKITALITAINAEEEAQRRASNAKEEFGRLAESAIKGFAQDMLNGATAGEAFANMINRLASQLIDLAIQMAIIKPLLASLGFSGGGKVSSIIPGFATGGYVSGPGGPKADLIPAMLSDGEYVVNAAATARHGRLLEAINSGHLAGFASGGFVGSSPLARGSASFSPTINVTVPKSSGDAKQDERYAGQIAAAVNSAFETKAAEWAQNQMRPGGSFTRRELTSR